MFNTISPQFWHNPILTQIHNFNQIFEFRPNFNNKTMQMMRTIQTMQRVIQCRQCRQCRQFVQARTILTFPTKKAFFIKKKTLVSIKKSTSFNKAFLCPSLISVTFCDYDLAIYTSQSDLALNRGSCAVVKLCSSKRRSLKKYPR